MPEGIRDTNPLLFFRRGPGQQAFPFCRGLKGAPRNRLASEPLGQKSLHAEQAAAGLFEFRRIDDDGCEVFLVEHVFEVRG